MVVLKVKIDHSNNLMIKLTYMQKVWSVCCVVT